MDITDEAADVVSPTACVVSYTDSFFQIGQRVSLGRGDMVTKSRPLVGAFFELHTAPEAEVIEKVAYLLDENRFCYMVSNPILFASQANDVSES